MNIIDFFTKVTGLTPTPEQKALLKALTDPTIFKIIVSAGRQTGKTLTCAVAALWWALEYKIPVRVLLISAQDNWLYDHVRTIFNANREEFAKQIVQEGTFSLVPIKGFETKRGSKCHVRGCTEKNIRGIGADIVFLDETAEMTDGTITTALGNLSGPISKIVLISTPHVSSSMFVKIASNPKKLGFKLFTWSSEKCPWHSKTLLATKKKMLTKSKYACDVLGRPPTKAERAFFPPKHIKKCIVTGVMPLGGIREGGLDFGSVVGKNVLTISEKNGNRRKVLFQKHYRKPLEEELDSIIETLRRYKCVIVKADSKPIEYQRIVGKKLGDIPVIYIDARFHKDKLLGQLQRHIMKHTIEIDSSQIQLILELHKYRRGKRSGDDRVDSLALSCYEVPYSTKPAPQIFIH